MKKILALLLLISIPAYAADKTVRGGTHTSTLQSTDSFLLQRNNTGPYFYINENELIPALSLTTSNVSEGSNLYYTNARADARVSTAIGASVQAHDADLDAAAAISATGLVKRTGAGAWTAVSSISYASVTGLGSLATQNGTFSGTSSGTNTGDITISGQNYLSLTGQALTANPVDLSSSNATGTLATGRFPALTGDVTTSAGSLATTLAIVNSNPGSFGPSTAIPIFTVTAKGLITAAGTSPVVAPAGTLTGNALPSTILHS